MKTLHDVSKITNLHSQMGKDFEKEIESMCNRLGACAQRTNTLGVFNPHGVMRNYDGGVDIIVVFDRKGEYGKTKAFFIQCKRTINEIPAYVVSDLYRAMIERGADENSKGVLIYDGTVSEDAKREAAKKSIELFTRTELEIVNKVECGKKLISTERKNITGEFLQMLLFCALKDRAWLENIKPETSEVIKRNIRKFNIFQERDEEEILWGVIANEYNKRISTKKLLNIIALTKEGKSCTEICKITGVTTKTVSKYKKLLFAWLDTIVL